MFEQIEAIRSGHNTSHAVSSHSTIFHDILGSKLPEHEKSTPRIADEAQLLVAAGTEVSNLHWTMSAD